MRNQKREFVVWNRSLPGFIRRSLIRRYGEGPFRVARVVKQKKGQEPRRKHHGLRRSRLWLQISFPFRSGEYDQQRTWFPSGLFSFMVKGYRKLNPV